MTILRAVLFDMDGTLTDSEKLWTVALDRTAADLGGSLSRRARHEMVGQDMRATIALMLTDLGVERPVDEVAHRLTEHTAEVFAGPVPWRPGAYDLLHRVRDAGLATALVTATHRRLVNLVLNTIGADNFDVTVCGDDVTHPKPDPEPYRRAIELLHLPAAACLAVEDSPNGSLSARRAGVPVLVVPCEVPVPDAPGLTFADSLQTVTVDDLRAIRGGTAA